MSRIRQVFGRDFHRDFMKRQLDTWWLQRTCGGLFPPTTKGRRDNRQAAFRLRNDRGFFSEKNVTSCKQQGVKVVCIPQRGGSKAPEREAYEKSREFKDGQRFRAGIEGRISVLFRGRGMKRCLAEGREHFELWSRRPCSPTTS